MTTEAVKSVTLQVDPAAAVPQRVFVDKTGADGTLQVAAAGAHPVGVSLEGRTLEQLTDGDTSIPVGTLDSGSLEITAGAVMASGVDIAVGADGKAVAAAAGVPSVGYLIEAATAVDAIVEFVANPRAANQP